LRTVVAPRVDDLAGGKCRGADVPDLAGVDQIAQGSQRLVDVGIGLGAVDLIEVDPVGLQPPQTVLHLPDDPAARVAELVRVITHRAVHLGRQHHVLAAPPFERVADDLLGLAAGVDVRGVEEVDPGVDRPVDYPDTRFAIRVAPGSEHHRPETERAYLDPGATNVRSSTPVP
jgi:hypothetical protein